MRSEGTGRPKTKPIKSGWLGAFLCGFHLVIPRRRWSLMSGGARHLITRTCGSEQRDHVTLSEARTTARTPIRRK